jgi:hypothetical protein
MNKPPHEPAILQGARRVRLSQADRALQNRQGRAAPGSWCFAAFSQRADRWMDALSNWTADEILLEHSKAVAYLLHKLQAVLAGGTLRATGLLALFYRSSFH